MTIGIPRATITPYTKKLSIPSLKYIDSSGLKIAGGSGC